MYDILILRAQDIVSDSRVLRYEKWFSDHGLKIRIVGWNRKGNIITRENTDYYFGIAGFQQKSKAVLNRMKWNFFLLKYLIHNRKNYQVIHACDFDTVLPALFVKLLGKKVIFDIFDWFSDEVKTGKACIDYPVNLLEKLAVKLADLTIICEEERLKQIDVKPSKYIVISNIPEIIQDDLPKERVVDTKYRLIISYVGGLVKHRGLVNLIESVKRLPDVLLQVAGYGDQDIEEAVINASTNYKNIEYYGKVPYSRALEIMGQSDVIYAMYCKTNKNHIFAAPNKFYESILLGKPIITTKGTLVGDKVEKYGNGFVIDEDASSLMSTIESIDVSGIGEMKKKIYLLQTEFYTKFDNQMKNYLGQYYKLL